MSTKYSPQIITDGLILYLDAANPRSYISGSTTCNDLSGNKNSGSLINGVGFTSSSNGSFVFDGTNDYITTEKKLGISSSNPRTFESWIYTSTNQTKNIMGCGSNNTGQLFDTLMWYAGGYLRVIGHYYGAGYDTNNIALPSRNTINLNQWNQIVHTYDGYTSSLYTNGIFSNSAIITLNTTDSSLNLGAGIYVAYNYIAGNIPSIKIYNKSLTSGEVLQNYNAMKGRYGL